jgi:signal transduction histidine kinase
MGRRIAETDWENTSLGRLEHWPRSFQSTVATILGSRSPMLLLWGEELLQFYNDACIGLIGARHPEALGRPVRENVAEPWDAIGPMISAVMTTGFPSWVPAQAVPLVRSGYLEESYFNLSYSAVDDDDGEIRGLLCVCSEVTEQVVGARRTELLRELVAAGEPQDPAATCEYLARIVAEHALDVPFAAFYLRSGDELELCGEANLCDSPVFPCRVALGAGHPVIPFERGIAGEVIVLGDIDRHVSHRGGLFSEPVTRALVMPIASIDPAVPLGVVIVGISPSRALDDAYRTFCELLVGRVSSLVRNAIAVQAERKCAEALAEIDRVTTELAETGAAHLLEVERKNQELEAFCYSISHELRAPLRSIDRFSEMIREDHGEALGPQGRAYLQRVSAAAHRTGALLDELLKLSRIELAELHPAPLDLSGIGLRVGESLRRSHPDREVQLVVEQGLLVEADTGLMTILLESLLGNAWKFTMKAQAARVELGTIETQGQRAFFVRDNGVGFDPHRVDRLFAPFHRLHSAKEFPGTGIGLATVRRIVERHGGRAWAEGKIAGGAAIYWTLSSPRASRPALT